MKRDPLDPRTQTDGASRDAKKSTAAAAKIPPSQVDLKVGIADQEPGSYIDKDVEASHEKKEGS